MVPAKVGSRVRREMGLMSTQVEKEKNQKEREAGGHEKKQRIVGVGLRSFRPRQS